MNIRTYLEQEEADFMEKVEIKSRESTPDMSEENWQHIRDIVCGSFRAGFQKGVEFVSRDLTGLILLILLILLIWPISMLAQQPPPIPPATNTLTYSIYQICFNETSNFLASATVTNVSTNGIPWASGDYAPSTLAWACCYFCPDQNFHVFLDWTWGQHTTNYTNFVSHTNRIVFQPYYVPAPGAVTWEVWVWPPTNIDPNALLIYSELLNTNRWHFWGDGKFYGNTVNAGEYLSPAFWRVTNSTKDPFFKIQERWNNQVIFAWSNNPHWQ